MSFISRTPRTLSSPPLRCFFSRKGGLSFSLISGSKNFFLKLVRHTVDRKEARGVVTDGGVRDARESLDCER